MIYAELEDVYAALIAAVHVDPARRVPQEWRDTMAGGVYKGKGKPIDGITSYRWLCFTSGLAKLYEAFLLYRAEPTVFPDEGQSIGCNGVDVRQLIVLIMERAVEREARKLTTLMLMDDAVRGFPSTSHEGSMLALVDEGARGGVTAGLAALIDGARIFPVIAPGQIAEPFVVDFGIWEGRRASPRQFGGQTRGTLAAARRTKGLVGLPQMYVDDRATMVEDKVAMN